MSIYNSFSSRVSPQSEPIFGRESEQVKNNAGGYVFQVSNWEHMKRFLIMGSEGGTYYVSPKALTKEAALATISCIKEDGARAVAMIKDVSTRGLAPSNDAALFALALAASAENPGTRDRALAALPQVARIPTHLFHFAAYVKQFRGYGRGLKRAIANWYLDKPVDDLAYQVVKYRQRDGYANRDLLRLSHPKTHDPKMHALFRWVVDDIQEATKLYGAGNIPSIIAGFELAKQVPTRELVQLIKDYGLSREMLPTEALREASVWEALLEKMPPTALIRNLGNMSKVGLLKPLSAASKLAVEKIGNREAFRNGRVHPISILIALKQYSLGHGLKGDGVWIPVPAIVDALDEAFYAAFDDVKPTGKSTLIAVDMSGSMMGSSFPGYHEDLSKDIAGTCLHPCEAAAALALACAKKEKNYYIMGFAKDFKELGITPKMRLDQAMKHCLSNTFGRTDCALPMVWAKENKIQVETFIVLTDNETWVGGIHPTQALKQYREASGLAAKEAVVAMVPTPFSIADPKDSRMLDVAGFSGETPAVIAEFSKDWSLA